MEGEKEASSQADGQPDAQSHVQSERDGRTDGDATATATGGLTDGGPESGGDSAAAAPVSSAAGGPSQSKEKDKEREGGGREREKEKGAARQRDRERERERGDRGRAGGQLAWMGGGRERTSGALRGVPSYPSAGMEFIGSQAPIPLIPLGPSGPSMLWVSVDQMHFILSLMLAAARLLAALYSPITDCDETMNYWEPLHFLLQGSGLQTWEWTPEFALRPYIFLLLYALPAKTAGLLLALLPDGAVPAIVKSKISIFFFVRIWLGTITLMSEILFARSVGKRFGMNCANYLLFFLCLSSGQWSASVALLPSSAFMQISMMVWSLWIRGGERRWSFHVLAVGLAVLAVLIARPFCAVMFISLCVDEILCFGLFRAIRWGVCWGLAVLIPAVAVDSFVYGRMPVVTVWNLLKYNVGIGSGGTIGGSHLYGVSPIWHYALVFFLGFNFFQVLSCGGYVVMFSSWPRGAYVLLLPSALWFILLSLLPHKEERFMYPLYPTAALAMAIGASTLHHLLFVKSAHGPPPPSNHPGSVGAGGPSGLSLSQGPGPVGGVSRFSHARSASLNLRRRREGLGEAENHGHVPPGHLAVPSGGDGETGAGGGLGPDGFPEIRRAVSARFRFNTGAPAEEEGGRGGMGVVSGPLEASSGWEAEGRERKGSDSALYGRERMSVDGLGVGAVGVFKGLGGDPAGDREKGEREGKAAKGKGWLLKGAVRDTAGLVKMAASVCWVLFLLSCSAISLSRCTALHAYYGHPTFSLWTRFFALSLPEAKESQEDEREGDSPSPEGNGMGGSLSERGGASASSSSSYSSSSGAPVREMKRRVGEEGGERESSVRGGRRAAGASFAFSRERGGRAGEREVRVCAGSAWHHFPSHFFLPDGWTLHFVPSGFTGVLPGWFDGASSLPPFMNAVNREEKTRYTHLEDCDFLFDFAESPPSPLSPSEEQGELGGGGEGGSQREKEERETDVPRPSRDLLEREYPEMDIKRDFEEEMQKKKTAEGPRSEDATSPPSSRKDPGDGGEPNAASETPQAGGAPSSSSSSGATGVSSSSSSPSQQQRRTAADRLTAAIRHFWKRRGRRRPPDPPPLHKNFENAVRNKQRMAQRARPGHGGAKSPPSSSSSSSPPATSPSAWDPVVCEVALDAQNSASPWRSFYVPQVVEEKGRTVWRSVCVWRRVGGAEGRASFEWLKRPYKSAEAVEEGGTLLHDEL